eukprot:3435271-Lingulodinium_polyedra.AAC.1
MSKPPRYADQKPSSAPAASLNKGWSIRNSRDDGRPAPHLGMSRASALTRCCAAPTDDSQP